MCRRTPVTPPGNLHKGSTRRHLFPSQRYAPLVGRWRGAGTGQYPTTQPFSYFEDIRFAHFGKPMLQYVATSWGPEKQPMHAESGFLSAPAEGDASLMMADPLGHTFIYSVSVEEQKGVDLQLRLKTINATTIPKAKKVEALERVYRVRGDTLEYEIHMAAMSHPLQLHLSASLQRVAEPVTVKWLRENLKNCIVIDVREPNEYSDGHIPGAHLFPLGQIARDVDNLSSALRALHERSSGSPLVLYCKSGYRSQLAQDEFVLAGLGGAVSLEGGWRAWEEQAKKG